MKNDNLDKLADILANGFKAFQDLLAEYQAQGDSVNAWAQADDLINPKVSDDECEDELDDEPLDSYSGLKTDSEEVADVLRFDDPTLEIQPVLDISKIDIDDPKYSYGFYVGIPRNVAINESFGRGRVGQLLQIKNGLFTEENDGE